MENHKSNHSRNILYNRSMSDTDSQTSQVESFHSPLRFDSPLRSDDPFPPPDETKSPSKALVPAVVPDKYYSPLRSPPPPNLYKPPPAPAVKAHPPMYNRSAREDVVVGVGPGGGGGGVGGEEGGVGVGGERRSRAAVASILRRPRRDVAVDRAALGFRVCEVIVCLISFSVMASDKTQGWSGDSFDRYKEYKYV